VTRVRRLTAATFRSMRTRNYRLYFYGQLISTSGTWMQSVALGWLVLRLTGSGFAVGLITAMQFVPMLLISAWGGVIADRLDKRRTLVATQAGMALCAAGLAAVTLTGVVQLWMLYVLTFASGVFAAIDLPVRQAFVSEMVGKEDLPNAVSLNSAMFNTSRIIGPALGALVIKAFDVGPCFALNAVSFAAVIAGLLMMRRDELWLGRPVARAKGQIREGLRYVWASTELRSTILLLAVVGTLAFNFSVVLPVLAKFTFHGDAGTYGLLTALMGAGAMVGALATASRLAPSPKLLVGSCLVFGVTMTVAAAVPTLMAERALMVLVGAASITFMATANSTCQLTSSPEMRGRVMALYGLVFLGSTPIGGPLIGWISQALGPRFGMGVGGVATISSAAVAGAVLLRREGALHRGHPAAGLDPLAKQAAA
jgi:MFS family permease